MARPKLENTRESSTMSSIIILVGLEYNTTPKIMKFFKEETESPNIPYKNLRNIIDQRISRLKGGTTTYLEKFIISTKYGKNSYHTINWTEIKKDFTNHLLTNIKNNKDLYHQSSERFDKYVKRSKEFEKELKDQYLLSKQKEYKEHKKLPDVLDNRKISKRLLKNKSKGFAEVFKFVFRKYKDSIGKITLSQVYDDVLYSLMWEQITSTGPRNAERDAIFKDIGKEEDDLREIFVDIRDQMILNFYPYPKHFGLWHSLLKS